MDSNRKTGDAIHRVGWWEAWKIRQQNKPITIRKKLSREKYKVLPTRYLLSYYRDFWKELSQIYAKKKVNPGFIRCKDRRNDSKICCKLKRKSREIMKLQFEEGNIESYRMAKKWCVAPHTLKQRAKLMGFDLLNVDVQKKSEDFEIWEMRLKNYMPHAGEVNLMDSIDIHNKSLCNLEKINNFKRTAVRIMNKMNYEDDSEESWNTLVRWFTRDKKCT